MHADNLNESENEFAIIFDAVPAMVFYKNTKNHLVRVNKTFAEEMHMTKEALEGKSIFDIYPREQAEKYWHDDQEVIASGCVKKNIVEPMNVGTQTRWVRTDKIPYRNSAGEIIGVIGFSIDITEMVNLQIAATSIAEDWARTFDAISDMILIIDKNHTIAKANKAATQILKMPLESILGKKCYELMHKTQAPWPLCPLEKTNADHSVHIEEVDDPAVGIPLLVTTSPIIDDHNRYVGVVHIAKDISERKKMEDALRKQIVSLERFQRITVDRELRMKELKAELVRLQAHGDGRK